MLGLVSCGSNTSPSMPTSAGAVDPSAIFPRIAPTFTISGTVYEVGLSGTQPLAGVPLDISVEYQSHPPQTTTDADGRYSATRSGTDPFTVKVEKPGYVQPCVARTLHEGTDNVLDIFVVRESVIRDAGLPAAFALPERTVSGVVFESTASGKKPVAGARLTADYSSGLGWGPAATTITDRAGRYVLCGLQRASIDFYVSSGFSGRLVPVESGVSWLDVELSRE